LAAEAAESNLFILATEAAETNSFILSSRPLIQLEFLQRGLSTAFFRALAQNQGSGFIHSFILA